MGVGLLELQFCIFLPRLALALFRDRSTLLELNLCLLVLYLLLQFCAHQRECFFLFGELSNSAANNLLFLLLKENASDELLPLGLFFARTLRFIGFFDFMWPP